MDYELERAIIDLDIERIREATQENRRLNTNKIIRDIQSEMADSIRKGRSSLEMPLDDDCIDSEIFDNFLETLRNVGFKVSYCLQSLKYSSYALKISW